MTITGPGMMPMVQAPGAAGPASPVKPVEKPGADFLSQLNAAVEEVDGAVEVSDEAVEQLATGQDMNMHQTMVSLEQADIALRTMVTVRDKVVQAYEQVMNMAI